MNRFEAECSSVAAASEVAAAQAATSPRQRCKKNAIETLLTVICAAVALTSNADMSTVDVQASGHPTAKTRKEKPSTYRSSGTPTTNKQSHSATLLPRSVQLADGSVHDIDALSETHNARLVESGHHVDRLAAGVFRIRATNVDQSPEDTNKLVISKSTIRGFVDGTARAQSRIDYRLSTVKTANTPVVVDIVGYYSHTSARMPERDRVWAAWSRQDGAFVMARYQNGMMKECHLYVNGCKRRSMSVDDDMSQDRGSVAHRHLMKALDAAGDATVQACAATARADRIAASTEARLHDSFVHQHARQVRQAMRTDRELQAVSDREAARATIAMMEPELFPCVPTRRVFLVSPVNLLSNSPGIGY